MSSVYVWLFILFNIIGLLSYVCGKVIYNIQLWAKRLKTKIDMKMQKFILVKDKIDDLKQKGTTNQSSDDEIEELKIENEILKHELKIVEVKLSLKKNGGKINFDFKAENADLRSQLRKVSSELESIKLEHTELEK